MAFKTQEISKVLNNFLQVQGYTDVTASFVQVSDSYYTSGAECSEIILGGLTNSKADEIFMKYCKTLGLEVEVSVETLSFLHELGHHNTLDFLDPDEIAESEFIKENLYMQDEETEEAFMQYFTCPEEMEATADAVEFCNHNPVIVKMFDKQLLNALYGE